MLSRLAFWTGTSLDSQTMLYLVSEHEGFAPHFEPDRQLKYDRWRLLYLARHGRIGPAYFEGMSTREVDGWIEELSEMLKSEMAGAKAASSS